MIHIIKIWGGVFNVKRTCTIFAMSQEQRFVIAKMREKSGRIAEHIAKCIIWKSSYPTYSHWTDEISNFINEIARIRCKSKIKVNTVIDNMFNQCGTDLYDALNVLLDTYEECRREDPPYPEACITKDDALDFFNCYQEISDVISRYISTHKITQGRRNYQNEIRPLIIPILNRYC